MRIPLVPTRESAWLGGGPGTGGVGGGAKPLARTLLPLVGPNVHVLHNTPPPARGWVIGVLVFLVTPTETDSRCLAQVS